MSFNNGKLYFAAAFFECQKIIPLVLLVLPAYYLATIVGHGQIHFQWRCHIVTMSYLSILL